MQDEFILAQVRRSNKNFLLVNLLTFLAVVLIISLSTNYFYNLLLGPFEMDAASLNEITYLNQEKEYVTVKGSDAFHSGLQYLEGTIEEGTNRVINSKVAADYIYLVVKDKLLVIKADPEVINLSYTGTLKKMSAEIKEELFSIIAEDGVSAMEFNRIVLPFLLDTQVQSGRAGGYIALITLVLLALLTGWNLVRYGQRLADSFGHPIYKSLRVFGEPESVAKEIDEDMAASGVLLTKTVVISDKWLAGKKLLGLTLIPLHDVLWVYKHITQNKINGIIPAGKTYCLAIHRRKGVVSFLNIKKKDADAVVEMVKSKGPHIICGYSNDLEALWNKSYSDFVAAIENRSAV